MLQLFIVCKFFHKTLRAPLARPPSAYENHSTDILVKCEAYPHAYKTESERYADDIAYTYGDTPLEDDTYYEGIYSIARGTQRAASEDIGCTTYFKEYIYKKHPYAHPDNILIVGEGAEDALPRKRKEYGARERDDHRPAKEVVAKDISRLMTSLPHKVSHEDVTALSDTQTEQIYEHDDVVAVGTRCQGLIAYLIDEVCDYHLRETIGYVLAHGWYADIHQVFQFLPRHRPEVA